MLFKAMSASVAGFDTDNDGDGEQQQQQQPRETLLQEEERVSLDTFPDEIILAVCELGCARIGGFGKAHRLYTLSTNPLLRKVRLHRAKAILATSLKLRFSYAQCALSRVLLRIRLKYHFFTWLSLPALLERGVVYRCGEIALALAGKARHRERELRRLSPEKTVECGLVLNGVGWGEGRREGARSTAKRLMAIERMDRYDPPRAIIWGLKRYFEKLVTKGGNRPPRHTVLPT
ncbi:hypothetical protein B9Z19DRAFT_1112878 [Tuber borchii]|uniref:Uncharacterized protein n=1 Tax=Tuber borchii TaxID=42251 RepID=A0A2T7A3Y3_TUBBO|nr:hypothetical protein B9Z19DRAFT_1112878 [Tuber borchii]